jgi:hypothetical protein
VIDPPITFKQKTRSRPILIAAVILPCALLLVGIYLLCTAPHNSSVWYFSISFDITMIFVIWFIVTMLRGLQRPMLTLHQDYLIYRRNAIPWSRIASVSPKAVGRMEFLGIALKQDGESIRYLVRNPAAARMLASKNDMLLRKYEAIIVPPAAGISVDELCVEIERYKADLNSNSLLSTVT